MTGKACTTCDGMATMCYGVVPFCRRCLTEVLGREGAKCNICGNYLPNHARIPGTPFECPRKRNVVR